MKKMKKKNLILAGIRVPLPKQGEKIVVPKTAYRRKREKNAFRREAKEFF